MSLMCSFLSSERKEIVDIVKTISHKRIKQRIVEKIADVPVPSIQEQIMEVSKMMLLERVSEPIVE